MPTTNELITKIQKLNRKYDPHRENVESEEEDDLTTDDNEIAPVADLVNAHYVEVTQYQWKGVVQLIKDGPQLTRDLYAKESLNFLIDEIKHNNHHKHAPHPIAYKTGKKLCIPCSFPCIDKVASLPVYHDGEKHYSSKEIRLTKLVNKQGTFSCDLCQLHHHHKINI